MGNNEDKFFTDWEETFDSFDQMGLHENLLRGIYAYGEQLHWKMWVCSCVLGHGALLLLQQLAPKWNPDSRQPKQQGWARAASSRQQQRQQHLSMNKAEQPGSQSKDLFSRQPPAEQHGAPQHRAAL
eukprot:1141970-Pelagomonas_calceolata.AAC.10